MKQLVAFDILKKWDKQGCYVFTKHMLAQLFATDHQKAFEEGLRRLVKNGILQRVCRGIYINKNAISFDQFTIERIAQALRPAAYSYVSLESALSEYGVISQIPTERITIMTTGRSGVYHTPYGTIEMTNTKRSVEDILKNTIRVEGRPLRLASQNSELR